MYLVDYQRETMVSDFDLLRDARKGDQTAFKEIVRRNKSRIASTIYGMLGKCDEAEDIGQEVFIRFYNSINNFKGDSALSTYLTRIAINLCLNELKRRKRKMFFSFDKMVEEGSDILDSNDKTGDEENKEIIRMALQKLSVQYRSVLVLRLIDGYSTEETAKILQIPLGTVLSRLTRAQMKLKNYLKPYMLLS